MIFSADRVETLMVNLRVLGKVGPGMKVNTKEKYLEIDDTQWYQSFLRWFRGDKRDSAVDKIHTIAQDIGILINTAIRDIRENRNDPSDLYMGSSPEEFLYTIAVIVDAAKTGIENLKDTYHHDTTLASKLELIVDSLSRHAKAARGDT